MRITRSAWDAVVAHAAAAFPEECCGLLLGQDGLIVRAQAARNTAADPTRRFRVDPADHFAAIRAARAEGHQVLGAYHSHPVSDPSPSETDRDEAFENEQFLHLIVRPPVRGGEPAIRCYRLMAGNFAPVALVRVP